MVTVLSIGVGNIGGEIAQQLREAGSTVITASRSSGDVKLDITSTESILSLDEQIPGGVDHVVITTGASLFGPLANLTRDKWTENVSGKLLTVSNLVLMLVHQETSILKDGGSITITTGQAGKTVNKMWPGLATNNAGLDMFVKCGGVDLPRSIRLNAVSPALVTETASKAGLPTAGTVPAKTVGAAYLPLIFGSSSGEVVDVGAQVVFKKTHDKNKDATEGEAGEAEAATEAKSEFCSELECGEISPCPHHGGAIKSAVDHLEQPSQYRVTPHTGVRGLLAYNVCAPLTTQEYDQWLYDIHYHDLMANPNLDKIVLNTISNEHLPILSSGKKVEGETFYRLAELHFASFEAYYKYVDWFKANPVPAPRTPAGKSDFKFYVMSAGESIERV